MREVKREISLREHQLRMLDILKDVHDFCIRNNIKYSLEGGTLLGAVRHKGFIPWDDDIDIIMPRSQYELFIKNYSSSRYELVTVDSDSSYLFPYARVCDKKCSTYDAILPCSKEPTGIWIDILVADGIPSKVEEQELYYSTCRKMRSILYGRIRSVLMKFKTKDFFKKSTLRYNTRLLILKIIYYSNDSRQRYVRKMIDYNRKYENDNTLYWSIGSCPTISHLISRPWDDFNECLLLDFEDSQFYVMKGYDGYLKNLYGDYLSLPPEKDRFPQLKGWYKFYVYE